MRTLVIIFNKNMKKNGIILIVVGLIVAGVAIYKISVAPQTTKPVACTMEAKVCPDGSSVGRGGPNCEFAACPTSKDTHADLIKVSSPISNTTVKSPLIVQGEARGSWYFEASFPIHLLDANGNEIISTPATAKGDWMTNNFVPFEATLTFARPSTPTGTLVLQKDNPSGDPAHDDSISIPVRFY